jgi:ketosteroid isomerase-like protein
MSEKEVNPLESLQLAFSRLDSNFTGGRAEETAEQFAEDARLMWPGMDDIVGRKAIEAAFGEFFGEFDTLVFSPDRRMFEICGDKAFTIGKFIEGLALKSGGSVQRVHGRLVEMWLKTEKGEWQLGLMLTGRYAENEILAENRALA